MLLREPCQFNSTKLILRYILDHKACKQTSKHVGRQPNKECLASLPMQQTIAIPRIPPMSTPPIVFDLGNVRADFLEFPQLILAPVGAVVNNGSSIFWVPASQVH